MNASEKAAADLAALVRARCGLLWIVCGEERRVEAAAAQSVASIGYVPALWDCASGVTDLAGRPFGPGTDAQDPSSALTALRRLESRQVWIFRDLHRWLPDPGTCRLLKSTAREIAAAPRDQARAIIVLAPDGNIPADLKGSAVVLDWPLPDREEVEKILTDVIAVQPESVRPNIVNGARDAIIDSALGLDYEQIERSYARSMIQTKTLDPDLIRAEKRRIISGERILEWTEPDPRGLESIGGLADLKGWLVERKDGFSKAAREFGLPAPKGLLLVGVPGGGKSQTAKAVSSAWKVPLLRLDLGALRSKFVGESEGNIRRALKVAETVSPCVLWLDEIEKALAGATGPQGDGGVASDALGTILTWLQERKGSVFVIATSNDVSALPPELLRKGRWDELFFVDLPDPTERAEILKICAKKYGRILEDVPPDLVRLTDGFTGAEMDAMIPDALYLCFRDGKRGLTAADLVSVAANVVPLAKTAPEKIQKLREWAKGRARPASGKGKEKGASNTGRALDL